ncbi:MAG TPA: class I SAM-dependent methyltransferase [Bacteroidales bacterium]|nr:class I SAM-dependent methyltransferase [Bacteroidales bacterium]
MDNSLNRRVCPVERAGGLDNSLRRLFQNPKRILKPYINSGMTVLDLGCGPGFFSIEIAKMMNGSGKVIAADLQEGMLEKVYKKIVGTDLEQSVKLHKCGDEKIGLTEKVDFVLAFYMIHEVSSQESLFRELKTILKPGGIVYIVEPSFHVSKKAFDDMVNMIKIIGYEIINRPKMLFGRTLILTLRE